MITAIEAPDGRQGLPGVILIRTPDIVREDPPWELSPLYRGGLTTSFSGKSKDYVIDRYFVNYGNRRDLIAAFTEVYFRTYPGRDEKLSMERMEHGLSHPKTLAQVARYEGSPVAIAILRQMTFDVGFPSKKVRVGYSTRAIEEEHENEGLGTMFLKEGIKAHDEGKNSLDAIALMTQNVLSIVTLRKALQRIGFGNKIHPFDELYTGRALQDLLLSVYKEVRMSSDSITTWNGVSEGELKELGANERVYKPDRSFAEAWEYNRKIVFDWGVSRERGDVVYVVAPRYRPDASPESVLALFRSV